MKFPADAPASCLAGTDHVRFDPTSLSMTETTAVRDTQATVKLGGATPGTFPVTTTLSATGNANSKDEAGTASVDVVLPASTAGETATLVVEGAKTGTSFQVPVTVVSVSPPPPPAPRVHDGGRQRQAVPLREGGSARGRDQPGERDRSGRGHHREGCQAGHGDHHGRQGHAHAGPEVARAGGHELTLKYLGTSEFAPSTGEAKVRVLKARPKVKVKVDKTIDKSEGGKVVVRVIAPDDIKARGKVKLVVKGTGKSVTGKLVDGKVVFDLPELGSVGDYTLKAKYRGSPLLKKASKSVEFELVNSSWSSSPAPPPTARPRSGGDGPSVFWPRSDRTFVTQAPSDPVCVRSGAVAIRASHGN